MKKIFPFSTKIFKKSKKSKKSNKDNKTEPNFILFKCSEAYNMLDIWSEITLWKYEDFVNILSCTNIKFPITIYGVESKRNLLLCKDVNEELFTIALRTKSSLIFSELVVSYKKEKFSYSLVNKRYYTNEQPKLVLLSYTKEVNDESNENAGSLKVYNFIFDKKNVSITQNLLVDNEKFYVINVTLLDKDNKAIFDKLFDTLKLEENFNDVENSYSLLTNFIKTSALQEEDLKELEITTSVFYKNYLLSKINFVENKVTEVVFTTEIGNYDLFSTGKLIFKSAEENISITINDVTKTHTNHPVYIDNIINDANAALINLKEQNLV